MLYAIICTDRPDSLPLRQANRPDHIGFLEGLGGKLKAAGPFLDEAGDPNGSLIVIEAETRDRPRPQPPSTPTPRPACSPRSRCGRGTG